MRSGPWTKLMHCWTMQDGHVRKNSIDLTLDTLCYSGK